MTPKQQKKIQINAHRVYDHLVYHGESSGADICRTLRMTASDFDQAKAYLRDYPIEDTALVAQPPTPKSQTRTWRYSLAKREATPEYWIYRAFRTQNVRTSVRRIMEMARLIYENLSNKRTGEAIALRAFCRAAEYMQHTVNDVDDMASAM